MIKEWLATYPIKNTDDATNALREIMQEITLAGLERSGFFEHAAFYGDTALRIFYGLNRFSEDLEFSLLQPNNQFEFDKHFKAILQEFDALGMKVNIKQKLKTNTSNIDSAFLKTNTTWQEIILIETLLQTGLGQQAHLKIKFEVDTQPPLGFNTEEKLLLKPFSFYVKCFTAPNLFAGKMHALLFRKWKNNVKGRDWFDLEWYIKKNIPINLNHFAHRASESGDCLLPTITKDALTDLLLHKIGSVDFNKVKADIIRFIPNSTVLNIWSANYFKILITHLKVS